MEKDRSTKQYIGINLVINIAEFLVDSFCTLYLLQKGATFQQIGIMWTIYLATTAITDYPTGGFADKYGRRKIYAIGILLTSCAYYIILSNNIFLLYISYAIKGLGTSFISGSFITWLSCDLKDRNRFNNTIAKTKLLMNICSFILPLLMLSFVSIKYNYIFVFCATIHLIIGVYCLAFVKENYGSQTHMKTIFKETIKYFLHNYTLIFITFVNIVLYLFFTIFYYMWQPVTLAIVKNNKYVPIFYGLYLLINGFSSYIMSRIQRNKTKLACIFVMLLYGLSFLSFYIANSYNQIVSLILGIIFYGTSGGIIFMLTSIYVNDNTIDEYKSSIYSLMSSICTFVNILFQFIFGKLIDLYGLRMVIILGMVLSILVTFGFTLLRDRNFQNKGEKKA